MNKHIKKFKLLFILLIFIFPVFFALVILNSIIVSAISNGSVVYSYINLSRNDAVIQFNNKDYLLQVFDSGYSELIGDPNINIFRNNSANVKYPIELNPSKQLLYISIIHDDNAKYCLFSADVTNIYYKRESQELLEVKILSNSPIDQIYQYEVTTHDIYLFPGRYHNAITSDILINQKVIGIYPVECDQLNDSQKQKEIVIMYAGLDPEEQREYLKSELVEN